MKKNIVFITFLIGILLFTSCSDKNKRKVILPSISGKAGEIAVIATKGQWETEPGTTIRSILATDCPYLPQREPLYTLFNVPQNAFTKIFQVHRNILFINIKDDNNKAKITVRKNIWAEPQTVITITAPNSESASVFIENNKETILNVFEQAERDRIIKNSKTFEEYPLRKSVTATIGGSPYFPKGYSMKKNTPNFIWISNETSYINQGIFIYIYPYTSPEQLTLKEIVKKRDEVLKENVPCMMDNSYMITNPLITPGLKWIKYNGREFAEVRGLWEAQNDFMGGPFVSQSFLSKDKKDIIVIEGFIYAPRFNKRSYLRQVESIIYSFEWKDKFAK
ncbi:MAG: DUF4837 family protein [Bacteroidales bacterium]|jgi:hypothetical protein